MRSSCYHDYSFLSTTAPCTSSPPHVHNGMRIFVGKGHGFQAKYKCFPGFKLTGMNSSYLMCNYGEWVGGHPHCQECEYGQIVSLILFGILSAYMF